MLYADGSISKGDIEQQRVETQETPFWQVFGAAELIGYRLRISRFIAVWQWLLSNSEQS